MTAIEALTACIEAFDKIAERNGPLQASSGNDWRRKVKIIAANATQVAEKALAAECSHVLDNCANHVKELK